MKRVGLVVLVVTAILCLAGNAFADIGENFAPAGIELYGDLYLRFNAGWVFWEFNEPQFLEIGIRPGLATFFAQNIAFYISPQFYYYRDLSPVSSFWEFLISAGVAYYFVRNPQDTTGFVPSLGVGISVFLDKDEYLGIGLSPRLRLLYFLTDRIAPYLLLEPTLSFQKFADFDFAVEDTNLTIRTYVGMSFYFPSKDYVITRR